MYNGRAKSLMRVRYEIEAAKNCSKTDWRLAGRWARHLGQEPTQHTTARSWTMPAARMQVRDRNRYNYKYNI